MKFKSNNAERYNLTFMIEKLNESLQKAHDNAVGPDYIRQELQKQLPNKLLQVTETI